MNTENNSRRDFLKKAAYTAPVLVGLGVLSNPTTASAASNFGPNNSDTNTQAQQQTQEFGHVVNGEPEVEYNQHWDEWDDAQV